MHIQKLVLFTPQLAEQKAFYSTTLGLPLLRESKDTFSVRAGTTQLEFQQTEQNVLYHVAFTLPRNTYAEAKDWLRQRTPLLLNRSGEDEIFFRFLNARSFYFNDADQNILEFIVHYTLDDEATGTFQASSMLHISEIGLTVEDVPAEAALLREQFQIGPYGGTVTEGFAFLGDIHGQMVVVKTGRPWLPTDDVLASVSPVEITFSGQRDLQVENAPYPYTFISRVRP